MPNGPWQDILSMLVSLALGTLVGWEREAGKKAAGLRTHTLVCMGSTLFVLVGRHAVDAYGGGNVDPTRVIHGVVTGVGFLGAGSIIRRHEGWVQGLTTAASVWIVAAIGVAVAVQAWALAVVGALLSLLVLEGYRWIEARVGAEGVKRDP